MIRRIMTPEGGVLARRDADHPRTDRRGGRRPSDQAGSRCPPRAAVNITGGHGRQHHHNRRSQRSIVGGDEAVAISNRTSAMIDIAQVQGQVHAQSVQKVGELADKNPNETVAIIRAWLHENAA